MTSAVVAAHYAKALVEIVMLPGAPVKPEDAVAQLETVEAMVAVSPDLHAVLMTPAIPVSRKKAVITTLAAEAGLSPLVRNFLCVILDHKRIGYLREIRQAFSAQLDEHMGIARAIATSAEPLTEAETRAIEEQLGRLSGKIIRMQTTVDPELLGGVVARIGSTVYDGSIRGQLELMRRKLASEEADSIG